MCTTKAALRYGTVARLASTVSGLLRPTVGRRGWPTYAVCGVAGFFIGLTLALGLARHAHLGTSSSLILALVPAASFLLVLKSMKRWLKRERIVFYEKAAAALTGTAVVLVLTGHRAAPVLDIAALGIGAFLAVGRIGCLCASCCHGRRARVGVRYRWEHAAGGYPARWVGLPVFPVQILDGMASALAVAIGNLIALGPHRDGSSLAAYFCIYGAARFGLEFLRGDEGRPYLAGLSEAQWIATISTTAAAIYRPSVCSLVAATALAAGTLVLVAARKTGSLQRIWLLSASHLSEIDHLLSAVSADGPPVTTSEGLSLALAARPDGGFDLLLANRGARPSARLVRAVGRQLGREWTLVALSETDGIPRAVIERRVDPQARMLR